MKREDQFAFDEKYNAEERITKERRATWLELFFDLAFVAVIAQITYLVGSHHSAMELYVFTVLFITIFWCWWIATANRNIAEDEDIPTTIIYQVQMFFALMMSMFLPSIFEDGARGFIFGLVAVRGLQLLLFVRFFIQNPDRRPKTYNIMQGFVISMIAWTATAFLAPPLQYLWWGILMVFDVLIPETKGKGNAVTILNPHHLQERLGLFFLLVLGESVLVVALASGVSGLVTHGDGRGALIVLSGLIVVVALWWLYFPYIEEVARGQHTRSLRLFLYSHIAMFIGVVLIAAGVKELVGDLKYGHVEHVNNLIIISIALIIFSFAVIKRSMGHFGRDCFFIAVMSLIVLVSVYLMAHSFAIGGTMEFLILAILFMVYVGIEYRHTQLHHKP